MSSHTNSKAGARLTVAAFYGALWLLLAGTWFGWGQFNPADERRVFAPVPQLNRRLPETLNLYLRDHFGFRGWFVTLNALLRAKLLHTSTTPKVIVGKQGFLFYAAEGAVENYMGVKPIGDCELESWVQLFERRARWLASRNVPLVVALVPDKESVYPEMMPSGIAYSGPSKRRADRFAEAIRSRTHISLVHLRPVLIDEKKRHLTYLLTDTHWSQWGAYVGYRELLRAINQAAPQLAKSIGRPLEMPDLSFGTDRYPGDLNRMLGLNTIAPEVVNTLEPLHPAMITGNPDTVIAAGSSNPSQPRLVMFRDSFGVGLIPYLGTHFSHIYAPTTWGFDPQDVLREKADLVVIEMVERAFNDVVPTDPENALRLPSEAIVNPRVWGILDAPQPGVNVSGSVVHVSGWAMAVQPKAIERIEVWVDSESIGEMKLHLPRPDVERVQPGMRDSSAAGVELTFDSRRLSNGRHQLTWKATDSEHRTAELGRRQFCVAN